MSGAGLVQSYGSPSGSSCRGGRRRRDHAATVPAVLRVHHRASDFVHRQSAGHWRFATETRVEVAVTSL